MTRRMLALIGTGLWVGIATANPVGAMDRTYMGGTGDFLDPNKWMPMGPPGTDDVAIISSGTATLNGNTTVGGLHLSGGILDGSGTLTVTGEVQWSGGSMGGTGTTDANGGLTITSAAGLSLTGTRTLNNAATATWTGSVNPNNQPSATLKNLSTGTFTIATSADFVGGNFVNQGALVKTAGSGDGVTRFTGAFNNTGSVSVMSGELDLDGAGTHTGTFSVDAGAILSFGGTNTVSGAGASVSGAGTVDFGGGTANLTGGTYNVTGTTRVSGGLNHTIAGGVNVISVGALLVSAGSFALSGGEMVTVPSYTQTGGIFGGSDVVTVSGALEWHSGMMAGSGTINANGGLTISADNAIGLFDTRTLNNAAAGAWTGAFSLNNQASATLRNLPSGTFAIATSADFFSGNFINQGTLTKTAGTGDGITRFTGAFNNSGAVTVMSGELHLENGGTHTGTFTADAGGSLSFAGGTHSVSGGSAAIGGAGTIEFGGGTANLTGGMYAVTGTTLISGGTNHLIASGVTVTSVGALMISAGSVALSSGEMITVPSYLQTGGTFGGSDTVNVAGVTEWHGGTMNGSGILNANGGLAITSDSTVLLGDTRTLNNAAAAMWTGAFSFNNQASATLRNLPTGTFVIATSADFFNGNFVNQGVLTKTAGSGDGVTRITGAFNNSGSVTVMSGELDLENGGTHTGTFSADANAVLAFAGGMHTVSGGTAAISGAGTIEFAAGSGNVNGGTYNVTGTTKVSGGSTHTIAAAVNLTSIGALVVSAGTLVLNSGQIVTAASYMQSGGTVSGADTVTVNGPLDWHGGFMAGSGTTNAAGGLMITADSTVGLMDSRTLNSSGAGMWTGGFNFNNSAARRLVNLPTGTLTIATSADFINGNLVNQGTLTKTTGTGDGTTRVTGTMANSGLLDIQSGQLEVDDFTQSAGTTRLSGGTLASAAPININGGRLEGNGTVIGGKLVNAAEVSPGLSPGAISVAGAYEQGPTGRFKIELGGLTAGTQFDRLTISGAAALDGTLAVSLVNGFTPALNDSFEVMTFASRTGQFAATSGLVTSVGFGFRPIISATSVRLQFGHEICDDGQDNDGDGQVDCADIKCAAFLPCSFTPTVTQTVTATATATASATPTVTPQPTNTVTPPVTITATSSHSPTPTATPAAACVGDCNGDRIVSIDELIRAVNIALGSAAIDTCRAADANLDGSVTISELITAVNNALDGCPATRGTSTPGSGTTPTPGSQEAVAGAARRRWSTR